MIGARHYRHELGDAAARVLLGAAILAERLRCAPAIRCTIQVAFHAHDVHLLLAAAYSAFALRTKPPSFPVFTSKPSGADAALIFLVCMWRARRSPRYWPIRTDRVSVAITPTKSEAVSVKGSSVSSNHAERVGALMVRIVGSTARRVGGRRAKV